MALPETLPCGNFHDLAKLSIIRREEIGLLASFNTRLSNRPTHTSHETGRNSFGTAPGRNLWRQFAIRILTRRDARIHRGQRDPEKLWAHLGRNPLLEWLFDTTYHHNFPHRSDNSVGHMIRESGNLCIETVIGEPTGRSEAVSPDDALHRQAMKNGGAREPRRRWRRSDN
jgi:hypothetical protein